MLCTDFYSLVARLWKTHSFAALTRSFSKVLQLAWIKIRTSHFLWSNLYIQTVVIPITKLRMLWKKSFDQWPNFSYASTYILRIDVGGLNAEEKDWNLIKTIVKNCRIIYRPIKVCWKIYKRLVKKKFLATHISFKEGFNTLIKDDYLILQWISERPVANISKCSHLILCPVEVIWSAMADACQLFVSGLKCFVFLSSSRS